MVLPPRLDTVTEAKRLSCIFRRRVRGRQGSSQRPGVREANSIASRRKEAAMDDSRLRRDLIEVLEGKGAHVGVGAAFAKLQPEHRAARGGEVGHTVWEEFEHLRIAQEDILRFTLDPSWTSPKWPDGYWPSVQTPDQRAVAGLGDRVPLRSRRGDRSRAGPRPGPHGRDSPRRGPELSPADPAGRRPQRVSPGSGDRDPAPARGMDLRPRVRLGRPPPRTPGRRFHRPSDPRS